MENNFPCCPMCRNSRNVGRIITFFSGNRQRAYFCAFCLIEFRKNSKILKPVWAFREKSL